MTIVDSKSTAMAIWQIAAARIRTKMAANSLDQLLDNIVIVDLTRDNELVLGVSDDFFAEFLLASYSELLSAALSDIDSVNYSYRVETGYAPVPVIPAETPAPAAAFPPIDARCAAPPLFHETIAQCAAPVAHKRSRSSKYTFANFVVGEENRYAFAAAQTVAQTPGICNPLYIYGDTGIGKTHLLQAVCNELSANFAGIRVRYTTCETILNDFVEAIRNAKTPEQFAQFRSSLRDVDVLLVDDIHALAKKKELQEQFFNAFNVLYNENKQIILTSDKQPCEIEGLEDRLISRFECGMTTEILPPGYETRLAILRQFANDFMCGDISPAVLDYMAQNISSNVRRLKGALTRVIGAAAVTKEKITVEYTEKVLRALLESENVTKNVSFEAIQSATAEYFGLRMTDILSNRRPRNIAEPRMVAMYLCRTLTERSYPEIGSAFGKNHATILNAMKKVPELCGNDENIRRAVYQIERQLKKH